MAQCHLQNSNRTTRSTHIFVKSVRINSSTIISTNLILNLNLINMICTGKPFFIVHYFLDLFQENTLIVSMVLEKILNSCVDSLTHLTEAEWVVHIVEMERRTD